MTKAAAETPTLSGVEELADRAEALEQQATELAEQEQDLTKQLAECHIAKATGVRVTHIPATPERIFRALHQGEKR